MIAWTDNCWHETSTTAIHVSPGASLDQECSSRSSVSHSLSESDVAPHFEPPLPRGWEPGAEPGLLLLLPH